MNLGSAIYLLYYLEHTPTPASLCLYYHHSGPSIITLTWTQNLLTGFPVSLNSSHCSQNELLEGETAHMTTQLSALQSPHHTLQGLHGWTSVYLWPHFGPHSLTSYTTLAYLKKLISTSGWFYMLFPPPQCSDSAICIAGSFSFLNVSSSETYSLATLS